MLTRTVAVSGAVICIGAAAELAAPTADALSIVIPAGVGGNGNTTQINILEGNIINPQLAVGSSNVSDNETVGGMAIGNGNFSSAVIVLGGPKALNSTSGNGNTTQINILSFNIVNPQLAIGGDNVSNNVTVSNVSSGNGNGSSTVVVVGGAGSTTVSGVVGNGNTVQFAFLSGNIFNPQWSVGGSNYSNNLAIINVSSGNGNGSSTTVVNPGSGTTRLGGIIGNGNTSQMAVLAGNIFNNQWTSAGSNFSGNATEVNTSAGNGNDGDALNLISPRGGPIKMLSNALIGAGNTNQSATLAGNIRNRQQIGIPQSVQPPAAVSAPAAAGSTQKTILPLAFRPGSTRPVEAAAQDKPLVFRPHPVGGGSGPSAGNANGPGTPRFSLPRSLKKLFGGHPAGGQDQGESGETGD